MAPRFLAQRILTGEWLDQDLPLSGPEITTTLSGAAEISATIEPEIGRLIADDGEPILDEWGTWIHVEDAGEIRASGIVVFSQFQGPQWRVESAGPSAYPHGIPWIGEFKGVQVDPLDMVRKIWDHVQAQPDGNIGVIVDDTTSPVRIGTEEEQVEFETGSGEQVSFLAGPYKLLWWEAPDCGDEIDKLMRETPFDFRDEASWNADKTSVEHFIRLGYPRLGRRQHGLRFAQDENITDVVQPERDGDEFANEVVGIGKGEGTRTARARVAERDGRVRRVHVLEDKTVRSKATLRALADDELRGRKHLIEIPEIEVDAKHPNAPYGSFHAGDDILVQAEVDWLGDVAIWHRVRRLRYLPDEERIRVEMLRSDRWRYGAPA